MMKYPFTLCRRYIARLSLLLGLALPLNAATYYVDYLGGSDSASGRSPEHAWKHAPGDEKATGRPASAKLEAGDTVIFKGGVPYFGSLRLTESGQPGSPITYDGNTAGTYGEGRAILDGGQVISNWQRVESADAVKGNPLWREMFYADIDVDVTSNTQHDKFVSHRQVPINDMAPWQRIMLSDGDRNLLPIAQMPKPKDPFFPDLPADFFVVSSKMEVDKEKGITTLTDTERLGRQEADAFADAMIGVHGGNNHVYFAPIKGYDRAKRQLIFPQFDPRIYDESRYAVYNSPRFIQHPGEWAVQPLGNGKSRVYLLPQRLEDGVPANVAYPVLNIGVAVTGGASHLRIQGFLIQRFSGSGGGSGGGGGISVDRSSNRSKDVAIVDNEIRFVNGHAGIGLNFADDLVVENNIIRHCPGWTSGIFINRITGFKVDNNFLDKNSGSGIRLYEGLNGSISGNTVLEHYGMHSSGLNLYEGCTDVVVENNFIENVITMNRNAERIIIRNNVVDAQGRNAVTLAIWGSGRTRGTNVRDIQIINNTFINTDHSANWSNGLYGQPRNGVSTPEGLVVKNNVMDRPRGVMNGVFENNIYLRETEARYMGNGTLVEKDLKRLFRDPENRDFRRRPGGRLMDAGATLPPPVRDFR